MELPLSVAFPVQDNWEQVSAWRGEDGKYYMHLLTGEGKTPPKWEEAGWTQPAPQLPGLEIFIEDVEKFAQNVMCQHYIISYGDNTALVEDLCYILGIEVIR